jgi:peptidoglycan hydrolase CwlO-like protein
MAIVDPEETARATKELRDIKAVVLDSAELATRSASLATTAGLDIKAATDKMLLVQAAHRKHNLIFLSASALIVTLAACVLFGTVVTQATRLTQIDAMLLAVGKRVTELDATMETVASVNEALNTMVKQQEENQALQAKLESRLDEVIKNTQSLPEVAAKQFEAKGQEMVKQVQSMDARLQTQANALRSVDQQLGKIQGQLNDSGQKLRQEVEALNRQQRERAQAEQNAARAAAAAAAAAAATTARQANPDRGVQYPRPVPSATPGQNPPAPATRP